MTKSWGEIFDRYLIKHFSNQEAKEIVEKYVWVDNLAKQAQEILQPDKILNLPPAEIYKKLKLLTVPECHIHLTNLGRVNSAENILHSVHVLLTTPGNFKDKFKAAKIPQAGIVTLSQLLTLAKPQRFAIRNTLVSKKIAKVIPFYNYKALQELDYSEFLDISRELARIMCNFFKTYNLLDWAEEKRFLLLYAILLDLEVD